MGLAELLLLSAGLAMDAFSVAVCKGLSMKKTNYAGSAVIALFFGFFQGVMPLIGFLLGSRFAKYISAFDHWVAFVLLGVIGGKMIFEALTEKESGEDSAFSINIKELAILAVATSIDALAVGIVFAARKVSILSSVLVIGAVTFILSFIGAAAGSKLGSRYEKRAEIAGGVILILLGAKILFQDLGLLP